MKNKDVLGDLVRKLDMFGHATPQFNIAGTEVLKTTVGSLGTILVFSLTLTYGLLQLQNMVNFKNPSIQERPIVVGLDEDYSLDEDGYMMAFSLEGPGNQIIDFDARLLRWVATTYERRNSTFSSKNYQLQPCTTDQFNQFYKAESEATESKVKELLERGSLFCLPQELE